MTDTRTLKISLKDWDSNSYVQGIDRHRSSGTYVIHQAVTVAGQKEQDIVLHQHDTDNKYLGASTVKRAGHGSSVGLEDVDSNTIRCWFRHEQLAKTGYVQFEVGETRSLTFSPVDGIEYGDVEIDQPNNRMIIRRGDRYWLYDLASVLTSKAVLLKQFAIPPWGKRWQGMLLCEGFLFLHRDYETGGLSWAHQFDMNGNLVGEWNTTTFGDEAEGFVTEDDGTSEVVYAIKRTGPTGAKRFLQGTEIRAITTAHEGGAMYPSVAAAWPSLIQRWEGVTYWMYLDTKAKVTTGTGNLIDSISAAQTLPWVTKLNKPATPAEVEKEWRRVKALTKNTKYSGTNAVWRDSAQLSLTKDIVSGLLEDVTDDFWKKLSTSLPKLSSYPADAQMALMDEAWQNGPGFLELKKDGKYVWSNTRAGVLEQDWNKAAAAVPGSGDRYDYRVRLFKNAAKVQSLGLDPSVFWNTKTPVKSVAPKPPVVTSPPAKPAEPKPEVLKDFNKATVEEVTNDFFNRDNLVSNVFTSNKDNTHVTFSTAVEVLGKRSLESETRENKLLSDVAELKKALASVRKKLPTNK